MSQLKSRVKEKLFYYLVERNPHILQDFQTYKWSHENRKENKLRSYLYLLALNFNYRVLRIHNFQQRREVSSSRKSNIKLPYLEGAESKLLNRPAPHQFVKQLLPYDIISFDIFDTLILRPFSQPHHLFMLLGEKHDIFNFMHIRRTAEKEARNQAFLLKGNREITIYDIYELVALRTGIDKEYGVQVELETEMDLCFANPYMKEVFEILKSQGKKLIAISDMYLTKDMIMRLLLKNGYDGFTEVFVSSENNCSKRDKVLYKIACKQLKIGPDELVHIGDNHTSDIVAAKDLGIKALHYKNVHEAGNKYRADGMSDLTGSIYSGIVNSHLHNGNAQYSPHYEYGFIYGGLYVMGYCQWIYNYAKKNKIDKVLFLSRDGAIYQRVFNNLFQDVDNEYVYWSRIANVKYTLEKNRDDFLTRMVYQKTVGIYDITLKSLLQSLGLDELFSIISRYGLKEDEIVHSGNMKTIEKLFIDNWSLVVKNYEEEIECARLYFTEVLQNSKKVAIIDVGWQGTGGAGIKYLVEEQWKLPCEVSILLAGSCYWNHTSNITQIMTQKTQAYMFSRNYNRNLYDVHSSTNKRTNSLLFELFTQDCSPSFAGFKKTSTGYEMMFDVPEVENYEIVAEVHRGILEFVDLYFSKFKNYGYTLNVSGYDAYIPFRMITKDLRFIKNHFGEFRFSTKVLADQTNQKIESLIEVLEKAGV